MANLTIYSCMSSGNVTDINGNYYPDVLTTNFNNFVPKDYVIYQLSETDIQRFDLFTYTTLSASNYDDIVLMYNAMYKNDLDINQEITVPSLRDITIYYSNNKKYKGQ